MEQNELTLGPNVKFLLPSLKLKQVLDGDNTAEQRLHSFLVSIFGGYTASTGNLFGYWKDRHGKDSYGEHREFTVAVADTQKLPLLKQFLAGLAADLGEDCIYMEISGAALLIYAAA